MDREYVYPMRGDANLNQRIRNLADLYKPGEKTNLEVEQIIEALKSIRDKTPGRPPNDEMKSMNAELLSKTLIEILEEDADVRRHPREGTYSRHYKLTVNGIVLLKDVFEIAYTFKDKLSPDPYDEIGPRESYSVELFGESEVVRLRNIAVDIINSPMTSIGGACTFVDALHLLRITSFGHTTDEQLHDKLVDLICELDEDEAYRDPFSSHLIHMLPYNFSSRVGIDENLNLLLKHHLHVHFKDHITITHTWLLGYGSREFWFRYSKKLVDEVIELSNEKAGDRTRLGPLLKTISYYAYAGAYFGIPMDELGMTEDFLHHHVIPLVQHQDNFVQTRALNLLSDYLLTRWCKEDCRARYDFGPLVCYRLNVSYIKFVHLADDESAFGSKIISLVREQLESKQTSGEIKMAAIMTALHCPKEAPELSQFYNSAVADGCIATIGEFPRHWIYPMLLLELLGEDIKVQSSDELGKLIGQFVEIICKGLVWNAWTDNDFFSRSISIMDKILKRYSQFDPDSKAQKELDQAKKQIMMKVANIQF